jgi:hypothetical protein
LLLQSHGLLFLFLGQLIFPSAVLVIVIIVIVMST